MAEIKWIKITTDIFDDEKIRIIERMPEGDAILIIWLKILTLAGKKNDCGLVYLTEAIPYTPEILSDIFNRDSRLISLAMNTFISFGMIVIEDDIIKVLNWEKHQNIEGMNKIREQTRKRVAKHREVKQIERCNVTVTKSNATDKNKIRLEGDKKEKENKDIMKETWSYWNSKINLPNDPFMPISLRDPRAIREVIQGHGIDKIKQCIDKLDRIYKSHEGPKPSTPASLLINNSVTHWLNVEEDKTITESEKAENDRIAMEVFG